MSANSCSFGTSQSVAASTAASIGAAGAGLRTVVTPRRRGRRSNTAAVVAWGVSNCATTTVGSTAANASSGERRGRLVVGAPGRR